MAEKPNRAPDWRIWQHLPTAKLHEAVALSLNIDPKRLDWRPDDFSGRRQFNEGREFDNRMFLGVRCLGETLLGPENRWAVHWDAADPIVRLLDFAAWAVSVGWTSLAELSGLAAAPQSAIPGCGAGGGVLGPISNNRGKSGAKMDEAVTAMVDAVNKGEICFSAFRRMKQKQLNAFYEKAGRTTLAAARVKALKQLCQQGYSDKDPT
jgi:hypothetical protein